MNLLFINIATCTLSVPLDEKCIYKSSMTEILKYEYLQATNINDHSGVGSCIMDGGRTRLFKKFLCHNEADKCGRCVEKEDVWKVKEDCVRFYSMDDSERVAQNTQMIMITGRDTYNLSIASFV